jgi:hypothetical protein
MSVANSAKLIAHSANLGRVASCYLFGTTAVLTAWIDVEHVNDAKANFVSNKLCGILGKRHCRSARYVESVDRATRFHKDALGESSQLSAFSFGSSPAWMAVIKCKDPVTT